MQFLADCGVGQQPRRRISLEGPQNAKRDSGAGFQPVLGGHRQYPPHEGRLPYQQTRGRPGQAGFLIAGDRQIRPGGPRRRLAEQHGSDPGAVGIVHERYTAGPPYQPQGCNQVGLRHDDLFARDAGNDHQPALGLLEAPLEAAQVAHFEQRGAGQVCAPGQTRVGNRAGNERNERLARRAKRQGGGNDPAGGSIQDGHSVVRRTAQVSEGPLPERPAKEHPPDGLSRESRQILRRQG